jgi:ribosome-associated protein YbcJ (S4-like RNA binding protein)
MRFLKQTASANIIYTGGLLKKTASDNNISISGVLSRPPVKFHMRFFKQTASANIIYTGGQLKKTTSDNDVVGTYMRLNGFRRSRCPSISQPL